LSEPAAWSRPPMTPSAASDDAEPWMNCLRETDVLI